MKDAKDITVDNLRWTETANSDPVTQDRFTTRYDVTAGYCQALESCWHMFILLFTA